MFHALVPSSINDSHRAKALPRARKKRMTNQPLTYHQLRAAMAAKIQAEHRSLQGLDNLNAALKSFCAEFGLRDDDVIGSELRASYYKSLAFLVDVMRKFGRTDAYIANRKSHLAAWRRLLLSSDKQVAATNGKQSPFQDALTELVSNAGSQRKLASEASISLASLRRWLSGVQPSARAITSIRRLERFFGLTEGILVELSFQKKQHHSLSNVQKAPIAYRERQKLLSQSPYVLSDVSPQLRRQWQEFVTYKTAIRSGAKARHISGKWRITTSERHPREEKAWYAFVNGQYVPTAGIAWDRVASYLGWLQLPTGDGGMAMAPERAQNLAWLVRDDLIENYLNWKVARAGNIIHSGIAAFPRFVSSVVNPKTGYLTLTPEFYTTLQAELSGATWLEQCARCFNGMKELKQHYDEHVAPSRNPFEPIRSILDLANPMDAIADMLFRMNADRPLTNGTLEAVWARDMVLIKMLMSNPLRIRNLEELTWRPDNSGQLRQRADGSWHITLQRDCFKNHRGAARDRDYDNPVDPSVWPILQQYLSIHRSRLLSGRRSDYVFLSHESESGTGPWAAMHRRVFVLTKRYLWGCPGVGPQAFRHIVATAILKNSPNDWQTAALVLHDRVETVQKHYAHLRSSDGARRMHELFEKTFSRA